MYLVVNAFHKKRSSLLHESVNWREIKFFVEMARQEKKAESKNKTNIRILAKLILYSFAVYDSLEWYLQNFLRLS
jgi:hypothetical protein